MRSISENVLALLAYVWFAIRTRFHLCWICANNYVAEKVDIIFGRNYRDMKAHKIVIFGDGFALGYGDWVTMGSRSGVSGYLADLIKSEARVRPFYVCVVGLFVCLEKIEIKSAIFSTHSLPSGRILVCTDS